MSIVLLIFVQALCVIRKSSKPVAKSDGTVKIVAVPKANLKVYNSSECFSIFMSRINSASLHDLILIELAKHASQEISPDCTSMDYQEHIGRTFVSALSNAQTYYERYLKNYSELCSVPTYNSLSCHCPSIVIELQLAQFHIEVLLRSIAKACSNHLFDLYDSSIMYQRLNAFCEMFYKVSLDLMIAYEEALRKQEAALTSVSSFHFIPENDVSSAVETIGIISTALSNGKQQFKDWLIQSVAVAVDTDVSNFPDILEGLISLARHIE